MCGLEGFAVSDGRAAYYSLGGIHEMSDRGYDSSGVAFATPQGLEVVKQVGLIPLTQEFSASNISIAHNRWATHGVANEINAHPHRDFENRLAVVHNGIVDNAEELKLKLSGHHFVSTTDTEVVAHLAGEIYKREPNNLIGTLSQVYSRLNGQNNLVMTDGQKIVAVRSMLPLILAKLPNGFAVSSDLRAFGGRANRVYYLDNDEAVEFDDKGANLFTLPDLANPTAHPDIKWEKAPAYQIQTGKEGYPHYILKEIHEQPQVIERATQNPDALSELTSSIKDKRRIVLAGCGSAGFAAAIGSYLLSDNSDLMVQSVIGSEHDLVTPTLSNKDALIVLSQSGETADMIDLVKKAREKGVETTGFTNAPGSIISRMVDRVIPLEAGPEKAVLSTKALTAMVAKLVLFAYEVKGQRQTGLGILRSGQAQIEDLLQRDEEIKFLAKLLKDAQDMYMLGRGLEFPVAQEAALKVRESTYIHAEGLAGGEMKHGNIACITEGTPVLAFASNNQYLDRIMSTAAEVHSRGAMVIGISPFNSPYFTHHFPIRDDVAESSMFAHLTFAQRLAYEITILDPNKDPDKPRNLAKSVTVR